MQEKQDRAEQLRAQLAKIEADREALAAELQSLEGGSSPESASLETGVEAVGRSVSIRGDAAGTTIITGNGNRILASEAAPELLLKAYLASLADECSQLPLGIIDTQFARAGGEHRVRLSEVYVELDVTVPARPATAAAGGCSPRPAAQAARRGDPPR